METAVKKYSLSDLGRSLKIMVADRYKNAYWIECEINKLNLYPHSGHAYPELVEKRDGKIVAQFRGQMWKTDFETANNEFLRLLKEPLRDGIKVLMLVKISFDSVYGLSLQIQTIDPRFSLGDLEAEKVRTVERLQRNKIFDLNKQQKLPLLVKRLAIISVESSKGYADFLQILNHSVDQYRFDLTLFPSVLQGEQAVNGIRQQLKTIEKTSNQFDAVAIIRGGGGDVGLSCYNNFSLCQAIATFPLPVFTGIGHATNQTVAELVAHTNAITPTKLAEMLLEKFKTFDERVSNYKLKIKNFATELLLEEQRNLEINKKQFVSDVRLFTNLPRRKLATQISLLKQFATSAAQLHNQKIGQLQLSIRFSAKRIIEQSKALQIENQSRLTVATNTKLLSEFQNLEHSGKVIQLLDPKLVLQRGYAMVRAQKKIITSIEKLAVNETIEIEFSDGTVEALTTKRQKPNE